LEEDVSVHLSRRNALVIGGASAIAITAGARPAAAASPDVKGSYSGIVTAVDPPLGSFVDLLSLLPSGVVIESRRYLVDAGFGKLLETTGHGVWTQDPHGAVVVALDFLLENFDSTDPVGIDNIILSLKDDRNGHLSGSFASTVRDTAGNTLLAATGTYQATRMTPPRRPAADR
jgi:hypothetical protein